MSKVKAVFSRMKVFSIVSSVFQVVDESVSSVSSVFQVVDESGQTEDSFRWP